MVGKRDDDPLLEEDALLTGPWSGPGRRTVARSGRVRTPGIVARNPPGSPMRSSLPMTEPSSDQITIRGGAFGRRGSPGRCTGRPASARERR